MSRYFTTSAANHLIEMYDTEKGAAMVIWNDTDNSRVDLGFFADYTTTSYLNQRSFDSIGTNISGFTEVPDWLGLRFTQSIRSSVNFVDLN